MKKNFNPIKSKLSAWVCATFILGATNAQAIPVMYKDRAAFDAAVAGISGVAEDVLDFDSTAAGTVIPSGSALGGVDFSYTIPGNPPFQIGVNSSAAGGSSGMNFLGVTNDGGTSFSRFALGDQIDFSFGASHAFGMYILVSNGFDFFDDDVNLTFGGVTLSNVDADTGSLVGPNNVQALFVGIVDTSATYTSASLRFGPAGSPVAVLFDIDDIVKTSPSTNGGGNNGGGTVPEPTTLALLGLGLAGLGFARLGFARKPA